MKIAVLGAGAMGLLFGGLLSRRNEVCIYGHHAKKTDDLKKNGVLIREKDGAENHFFPQAAVSGDNSGETPDVVMLFTKSLVSREVLEQNRGLFGPDTLLLTLQNGCGHEELLKEFVDESRVVIGTTRHNSVLTGNTSVLHGGGGATCIGFVHGRNTSVYALGEEMSACGIETSVSEDIRRLIWDKLFVNTSVSVVSGILQVPQGYLLDNAHAWSLVERLAREAIETARAEGIVFEPEKVLEGLRSLLEGARQGYPSIYADLRDGRKTEVDAISGSVVRSGHKNGVPVPSHEMVVELVHAMEGKTNLTV